MDRKNFLTMVGMSAASFALINCIGCSKSSDSGSSSGVSGPTGVDFTLDLTASANAALLTNGGSLKSNGVIVARTTTGAYIAVQQSCTHESYPLVFQGSNQQFYCNNHGATFSQTGAVTGGPTNKSLTTYTTVLTGTSLRVHS
ncbi:QcrA and Rieske domain-containing protein [Mucilaginibacter paludis]|uniref:Rieske (2Fe-2S) iron-sulfur domain-containing protein n=1 Tax=Mucilaginibacter paludis DSM 18603 TaxID=714943 RepID=H1XZB8_9SPHI|nr:Rieske 2Fe-2S domain-containing protein [Mucilaginibacter paludis]EHQ25606.1 Rieske (2Fe-2S) iron-sulfur domain-containing protein [Mucilaginibacter paludis DSM 18603]